ncbi:hypothetical protein OG306_33075 [Streptomyces sp. NBC_01241]|uniref:hypothetical protein n=1 Tax=Streptomyces sp. NBC_01241 TaxID=2903794 RepID=UPI00352D88F4|nr:hypothetical protein OG306_33075 [Streptomyces sp. NBC_01241]
MKRIVKNLSVMRTDGSDEALELIRETGMTQSEATRWALSLAANILQHAWVYGYEEHGKVPEIQVQFKVK